MQQASSSSRPSACRQMQKWEQIGQIQHTCPAHRIKSHSFCQASNHQSCNETRCRRPRWTLHDAHEGASRTSKKASKPRVDHLLGNMQLQPNEAKRIWQVEIRHGSSMLRLQDPGDGCPFNQCEERNWLDHVLEASRYQVNLSWETHLRANA